MPRLLLLYVLLLATACAGPQRPLAEESWVAVAGEPLPPPPEQAWMPQPPLAPFTAPSRDANAAATTALAPAGDPGTWTWDLGFRAGRTFDYGELECPAPLPAGTTAIGVRWRPQAGVPAPVLRLRLRDVGGEIHQFTATRGDPAAAGWRLAVVPLAHPDAVWGGDANRRLDAPVQVLSLVADRPWRGFAGDQRLLVAAPQVLAARAMPADAGLALAVADPPLGHCYPAGGTARLRATLPRGSLRWTVIGLDGRIIQRGEGAAPAARIDLALPGPGWWECRIEAEDGAARSALAYRCAVLAEGSARHDRLGVCVHVLVQRKDAWPLAALELVPRLGLGSVREELAWNEVERPAGTFALPAHHQAVLERMRALALDPLLILYAGHRDHGNGWPLTPAARTAYAGYAARAAAALPWVRRFEVWNEWAAGTGVEPRLRTPGANTPSAYAALLAETAPAVRAVRPDAQLAGIGGENITARRPHFGDRLLWEEMLAAGAGAHMDTASFHPYRWSEPPEATGLAPEVAAAARRVRALGGPERLWITEIGWTSPGQGPGVGLREQGGYTVRALALLAAEPAVERTWLYDLLDDGTDAADKEHHFGLFGHPSRGLLPKPSAALVAAFARATAGAECRGRAVRDDAWAVRWTLPGGDDLVMAWSAGAERPLAALVAGTIAEARDAAGALLPGPPELLGSWPVYLRGRGLVLAPALQADR